jgi:hypothetical protein
MYNQIEAQILTLAIPLGAFIVGALWLFFVRRPRT